MSKTPMFVLFGTPPLTAESGCFNSHIAWGCAVDASSCQEIVLRGGNAAFEARSGPVCRHSGVFRA